jgi:hypothetical protein
MVAEDFITNFGITDLSFSALTPLGGASAVAAVQCAAAAIPAEFTEMAYAARERVKGIIRDRNLNLE